LFIRLAPEGKGKGREGTEVKKMVGILKVN
jgi:hypothetical protein